MRIEKDHIKKAFGLILTEIRTEKGITHVELEDLANVTRKHIYNLEKGIYDPTLSVIFKLAHALDIEPELLVSRTKDKLTKIE